MRTNQLAIEEIIKVICQYLVTTMMILLAPGEKTDPIERPAEWPSNGRKMNRRRRTNTTAVIADQELDRRCPPVLDRSLISFAWPAAPC